MKLSALLTLIGFTAVAVGHPHSLNQGECMEMRSPARGSRNLWFSHESNCLEDIDPPKEEELARKVCRGKARRYVMDFFKDDKLNSPKNTSVDDITAQRDLFYAKCLVERLDLVFQNGSLDTNKVLRNAAKLDSSDSAALMNMHTWMRICIAEMNGTQELNSTNTTSTANITGVTDSTFAATSNTTIAAMQYMGMKNCIQQLMREHCYQEKLLIKAYLESSNNESVCSNITAQTGVSEVTKVFQTCMAEASMRDITDSKFLSGAASSSSSRSGMAQMMLESTMCTLRKMNWFTPEKGLNMTSYRNYVANFTGWKEIPKVLEKLSSAMNSCLSDYTGDVYTQVYHWRFCFTPAVVDECGFNSNVTDFLLPFTANNIGKAVKEYVHEMMDMDDDDDMLREHDADDVDDNDDDYDEDFSDDDEVAEMVDDGFKMGLRQSRIHVGKDNDDGETMTESAEVEVTGVPMAQLQLKETRGGSNEKENISKESSDGVTTEKSLPKTKSKDTAKDATYEGSVETTDDPNDVPDVTTGDDFLLL